MPKPKQRPPEAHERQGLALTPAQRRRQRRVARLRNLARKQPAAFSFDARFIETAHHICECAV